MSRKLRKPGHRSTTYRPRLESLEARRLFAVDVMIGLADAPQGPDHDARVNPTEQVEVGQAVKSSASQTTRSVWGPVESTDQPQ